MFWEFNPYIPAHGDFEITEVSGVSLPTAMASQRTARVGSVMLEDIPRIQPGELAYEGGQVERGSFGDVRKAKWQGLDVAVKLFFVADKKGGISEEVCRP